MQTHGQVTDDVPQIVLDEIFEIASNYKGNDLGGDNYQKDVLLKCTFNQVVIFN